MYIDTSLYRHNPCDHKIATEIISSESTFAHISDQSLKPVECGHGSQLFKTQQFCKVVNPIIKY